MRKSQSIVILIFLCSTIISAQNKYHISKPVVSFGNNILTIKYDITGCGRNETVDVSVLITNSKGDTLNPVFITGDIGRMIPCGPGKTIEWNLEKDNIKINDNIEVFVKGTRSSPVALTGKPDKYSRAGIMLSSALFPGWGQSKASGKSVYFVTGGLFFGTAGASLLYALKTPDLEQKYLDSSDLLRDEMYRKWQNSYDMSRYLAIGAAGIWVGNMIWAAVIPVKTNRDNFKISFLPVNDLYMISAKWNF